VNGVPGTGRVIPLQGGIQSAPTLSVQSASTTLRWVITIIDAFGGAVGWKLS
jgi:hypothetical protein